MRETSDDSLLSSAIARFGCHFGISLSFSLSLTANLPFLLFTRHSGVLDLPIVHHNKERGVVIKFREIGTKFVLQHRKGQLILKTNVYRYSQLLGCRCVYDVCIHCTFTRISYLVHVTFSMNICRHIRLPLKSKKSIQTKKITNHIQSSHR